MRPLTFASAVALLLVPLSRADVQRAPVVETRQTFDLARLTYADALDLDGKPGRFLVFLDSLPNERGRWVGYDFASPDEVERTVYLEAGTDTKDEMVVEATFRVLYHPRSEDGNFP